MYHKKTFFIIINTLLFITILFSIPELSCHAIRASDNVIFRTDFEGYETSTLSTGSMFLEEKASLGGSVVVQDGLDESNTPTKVLKISATQAIGTTQVVDPYMYITPNLLGKTVLMVDLKTDDAFSQKNIVLRDNNSSANFCTLLRIENSKISLLPDLNRTDLVTSVTTGNWYKIKLIIDTDTKTVDAFVNGEKKASQSKMLNLASNFMFNSLTMRISVNTNNSATAKGNLVSLYVDNLKLYSYSPIIADNFSFYKVINNQQVSVLPLPSGNIIGKTLLINNEDNLNASTVVLALYRDKILKSVSTQSTIIQPNLTQEVNINFSVPDDTENYTSKLFLLNNLSQLTPFYDAEAISTVRSHPFLIVKSADYPTLQSRSATAPWSTMKTDAISTSAGSVISTDTYKAQCIKLGSIASASSLAYILDPINKTTYINRIVDMVNYFDTNLYAQLNDTVWDYTVPPSGAFFDLVLAVDVIYNDLSTAETLSDVETKLSKTGQWYHTHGTYWMTAVNGARGIWALYKGDTTALNIAKNEYKTELLSWISDDGVYKEGSTYASARLAPNIVERDAKTYFMDVLEYTHSDNTFYTNSKLKALYEWLFAYSVSPISKNNTNKLARTFGDTNSADSPGGSAAVFRAYKFSPQAASYAAWANGGIAPRGQLIYYTLMGQALPTTQNPTGKIYNDAGAWFVESKNSNYALSSGMLNIKDALLTDDHKHYETNAIDLTAYGETVLRNSGYNGWYTGWSTYTWDYIHNTAKSGNTITIDGVNHQHKYGTGIKEGFIASSNDIGYASANSGTALPNGTHTRNLLQINPHNNKNGYWILIDEVTGNASTTKANQYLHPNSNATQPTVVSTNVEYRYQVSPYKRTSNHPVYLNIFYATTPTLLTPCKGALAGYTESFEGSYLQADYNLTNNDKKMLTVLYPSDATYTKASMLKITGTGFTGVSIDQGGGTIDYAFESNGSNDVTNANCTFKGIASWYRKSTSMTEYFVKKGCKFDDDSYSRKGFDSNESITVYMADSIGKLITNGDTLIKFYYPGIKGIKLNGVAQSLTSSGTDWVAITPSGSTYSVELTF